MMSTSLRRSRFGCMTCRKRKVKCDETYPDCRRCIDTGRKCDSPSKNKFVFVESRSQNASQKQSLIPPHTETSVHLSEGLSVLQLDPDETRALEYFLCRAGPSLAGAQDGAFWTSLVPQVCHIDAATRNAVLVISHMFENPPEITHLLTRTPVGATQSKVLRWHSRSINGYHTRLKALQGIEQTEMALLSCVLLTSIQYQWNNIQNAMGLLKGGYDIAGTLSTKGSTSVSWTIKELLIPILARQTVLMTMFGCPPPPDWFQSFQKIAPTPITSIASLSEARARLYICLWRSMEYVYSVYQVYALGPGHAPLDPRSPLHELQKIVVRDLGLWHRYLVLFTNEKSRNISSQDESVISSMLMYYHIAFIWVSTCVDATQMNLDRYVDRFESVIGHAEKLVNRLDKVVERQMQPSFSFEMGIVPPLYFTGCRCRHPLIRRKALELMKKAPKQEALFATGLHALAVEKIIELEENEDLANSIRLGTWDGRLPDKEDRCQDSSLYYEFNGRENVAPEVHYIRGTWKDTEGKEQHARGQISLV